MKKTIHFHKWQRIEGTNFIYKYGHLKMAKFKCEVCGKEKWFDIFDVKEFNYENNRRIKRIFRSR